MNKKNLFFPPECIRLYEILWRKKRKQKFLLLDSIILYSKVVPLNMIRKKKTNEWMGQRLKIDSNYKFTSISNENYNFALDVFKLWKQHSSYKSNDNYAIWWFSFLFWQNKSITAYTSIHYIGNYFEWIHGKMLLDRFKW